MSAYVEFPHRPLIVFLVKVLVCGWIAVLLAWAIE